MVSARRQRWSRNHRRVELGPVGVRPPSDELVDPPQVRQHRWSSLDLDGCIDNQVLMPIATQDLTASLAGRAAGCESCPIPGDRDLSPPILIERIGDARELRPPISPDRRQHRPVLLGYELARLFAFMNAPGLVSTEIDPSPRRGPATVMSRRRERRGSRRQRPRCLA